MGLPYKKGVFLPRWKMVKANGHSALPITPDGFAWDSCHPAAVAVAHPRSHIVTFLAPLGQAQPSVQGAQWPSESIHHTLSARALLMMQTPGASETSPGGDGLYLGKHYNMRSCACPGKAWRREERGAGGGPR